MLRLLCLAVGAFGVSRVGGSEDAPLESDKSWIQVGDLKTHRYIAKRGKKGKVLKVGDDATMHVLAMSDNGTLFSTTHRGDPFNYTCGGELVAGTEAKGNAVRRQLDHRVCKGWDEGAIGMRVGEVRKLRVPAAECYDPGGFPTWGIEPGQDIEFFLTLEKLWRAGKDQRAKYDPADADPEVAKKIREELQRQMGEDARITTNEWERRDHSESDKAFREIEKERQKKKKEKEAKSEAMERVQRLQDELEEEKKKSGDPAVSGGAEEL